MTNHLNPTNLQGPFTATLVPFLIEPGRSILVYARSIHQLDDRWLFSFKDEKGRHLGLLESHPQRDSTSTFEHGSVVELGSQASLKVGAHSPHNAQFIRERFNWTAPRLSASGPSFGLGDRLGLAGPAHIRAVRDTGLFPILAQQSIRELERTRRTPQQVIDCATFSAFQEDFQTGFGADADHLKSSQDIDRVLGAGFGWFTIDPGDHVINEADKMSGADLETRAAALAWSRLGRSPGSVRSDYSGKTFEVSERLHLRPSDKEIWRAWVKYGQVILHVHELHSHLRNKLGDGRFELELSVDETDSVTSPFEHFLIVSELKRLGVRIDSIAPRFVGRFEKGVDFRGSQAQFEDQLGHHVAVSRALGPYKLSLHSGSDKFSIYPAFARECGPYAHVKTAGTSYLEALRALAELDLPLFREILRFSRECYPTAKASYHVSAELSRVPDPDEVTSRAGGLLFEENDDARQVLHVAYGDVLCAELPGGESRFRNRILGALEMGEDVHFRCLEKHFGRHFSQLQS